MKALATELQKPEYAGLSDQAAADMVNAKMVSKRVLDVYAGVGWGCKSSEVTSSTR